MSLLARCARVSWIVVTLTTQQAMAAQAQTCPRTGTWTIPSPNGSAVANARDVLQSAVQRETVLLGEAHDRVEHHRWQLQTLAMLYLLRPNLIIGFEMFPRRVQPVLDRWVAGELSEAEFLRQSDWDRVWGYDARYYLPLFHFARVNRIPMFAMNVERNLIGEVARNGWDSIPEAMREGIGNPAAPSAAYVQELHASYLEHPGSKQVGLDDPDFARFVQGQLTWDRAMAEAISSARRAKPPRLVVAVLGRGHALAGAVPHQLRDLGLPDPAVLLPWDIDQDCSPPDLKGALAAFSLRPEPLLEERSSRPRLGVALESAGSDRIRIERVVSGSVAEAAGLRAGDILLMAAGLPIKSIAELQRIVSRQAPGTWLPVQVLRDSVQSEVVAKFPPD
jgi:uncharacterized iron-regulated protein